MQNVTTPAIAEEPLSKDEKRMIARAKRRNLKDPDYNYVDVFKALAMHADQAPPTSSELS